MVKEQQRKINLPGRTTREMNILSFVVIPVLFVISAILVATDLILPETGELELELVVWPLPTADRWYALEMWSGVKTGAEHEVFSPDDRPIAMEDISLAVEQGKTEMGRNSSTLEDRY